MSCPDDLSVLQGPPVLRGFLGAFRGYAGEISPAAALDAVASDSNTVIVDIRTEREKENAGLPDLPSGNRSGLLPRFWRPVQFRLQQCTCVVLHKTCMLDTNLYLQVLLLHYMECSSP